MFLNCHYDSVGWSLGSLGKGKEKLEKEGIISLSEENIGQEKERPNVQLAESFRLHVLDIRV